MSEWKSLKSKVRQYLQNNFRTQNIQSIMAPGLRGFFGEESSCDGEFLIFASGQYLSCQCLAKPLYQYQNDTSQSKIKRVWCEHNFHMLTLDSRLMINRRMENKHKE